MEECPAEGSIEEQRSPDDASNWATEKSCDECGTTFPTIFGLIRHHTLKQCETPLTKKKKSHDQASEELFTEIDQKIHSRPIEEYEEPPTVGEPKTIEISREDAASFPNDHQFYGEYCQAIEWDHLPKDTWLALKNLRELHERNAYIVTLRERSGKLYEVEASAGLRASVDRYIALHPINTRRNKKLYLMNLDGIRAKKRRTRYRYHDFRLLFH